MFTMHEIIPRLWLGGISDVEDYMFLLKNNILSILSILSKNIPYMFEKVKLKRKFIRAADETYENLLNHFKEAFKFIDANISNG